MKIVADKEIPFLEGIFEPFAQVQYLPGSAIDATDVRDADALIVRTRTRCDRALLEGSRVKIVSTATIGSDHIDTAWCAANGIEVTTAAGCNARGVLQWVGAVLALLSRKGGWRPEEKTLGIVGVGNVGSLVEEYGRMWGFRILCCDPPRGCEGFIGLQTIANKADIVTFHVPLTNGGEHPTRAMANGAFFEALRPGTLVINSSRGEVVDEEAFKNAIDGKGIKAAVDTWAHEPAIDCGLVQRVQVATTHIAGYTVQGKSVATAMAAGAVADRLGLRVGLPSAARDPRPIAWDEMCASTDMYINLYALSKELKNNPKDFEAIRTAYRYREEFY